MCRVDFSSDTGWLEMQVLGLIGRLLSGPWMKKFYTAAKDQIGHIDGISAVKNVVDKLKKGLHGPVSILKRATDFFGNKLDAEKDSTLKILQQCPSAESNRASMIDMLTACITATITILKRQ